MRHFIFVCALACGGLRPETWIEQNASSIDTLCAFAPGPTADQVFKAMTGADQPTMVYTPSGGLELVVNYGCFSSSCDRNAKMTCSTSIAGTTITVVGDVSWQTREHPQECTADCGYVQASCKTGPLEQGLYRIVVGDRSITLATSGMQAVPCSRR